LLLLLLLQRDIINLCHFVDNLLVCPHKWTHDGEYKENFKCSLSRWLFVTYFFLNNSQTKNIIKHYTVGDVGYIVLPTL